MTTYFPKRVIEWSKNGVLHEVIGSALEDNVFFVVQNINLGLINIPGNHGLSIQWKELPYESDESTTEDFIVD